MSNYREGKQDPIRYTSPNNKTNVEQVRVVKHSHIPPSVHKEQKSEVREHSNPPSVSPTVSFGANNSGLKAMENKKVIQLDNGDSY